MTAILRSNSGRDEFAIEFETTAEYAHDDGLQATIHLRGERFDVAFTHPFSTSIEGLWLRLQDLKALRDHIARWTARPLELLIAEDLNAEFRLTRLPDELVRIRFGPREGIIAERNPVVTVTFVAGRLSGEFHFVTDQSCLGMFARELSDGLGGS